MLDVQREAYVSLATYRRSGAEVRTPVWFAVDPSDPKRLWVYTNGKSGKVKRIRNGGRARLAACDARGRVRGDWCEAHARILEGDAAQQPAFAALEAKYGWQARLLFLFARLGGRWKDRTIVSIELA
jgi:hypothetical protein